MGAILLATDGSEHATEAATVAIERAQLSGVPLYVLCVVDSRRFNDPALSSAELATIYAEDHATVCVGEVTDMARSRDVVVHGDTRHGIPHEVILEYAGEVGADLIVIGEHGDHEHHFSGVGQRVEDGSTHAVVIVRAGSTANRV